MTKKEITAIVADVKELGFRYQREMPGVDVFYCLGANGEEISLCDESVDTAEMVEAIKAVQCGEVNERLAKALEALITWRDHEI